MSRPAFAIVSRTILALLRRSRTIVQTILVLSVAIFVTGCTVSGHGSLVHIRDLDLSESEVIAAVSKVKGVSITRTDRWSVKGFKTFEVGVKRDTVFGSISFHQRYHNLRFFAVAPRGRDATDLESSLIRDLHQALHDKVPLLSDPHRVHVGPDYLWL